MVMNIFISLRCAIMPFPAGKLLYLALKQVARPVSRQLQALSRRNDFMKRRVLVPTGQRKLPHQCRTVSTLPNTVHRFIIYPMLQ